MSKRDLKNYLSELSPEQIQEQFMALYVKFPDVKTYYDFVFNPNEEKLQREAKIKVSNEYFPTRSKRGRRSRHRGTCSTRRAGVASPSSRQTSGE